MSTGPLELKDGSLSSAAVKVVIAHPSGGRRCLVLRIAFRWCHPAPSRYPGKWLYVFVSFGDNRPGELRTFAILSSGHLNVEFRPATLPSGGYQPCHAEILHGDWMAVAQYLSGAIAVFDVRDGLPSARGVAALPLSPRGGSCLVDGDKPFRAPTFGDRAPMACGLAFSPNSRFLVAADSGQGALVSMEFDSRSGALTNPVAYETFAAPIVGPLGQSIVVELLGHRPRCVAFSANGHCLICLQECTNTLTIHKFNIDTGRIGAAHQMIPTRDGEPVRRAGCGVAHCLASVLPLPHALAVALQVGVSAAKGVVLHAPTNNLFVSTRTYGGKCSGGATPSVLALNASADPLFLPLSRGVPATLLYNRGQFLEVGKDPRYLVLDKQQQNMIVGGSDSLTVFAISPTGGLTHRATSLLPGLEAVHCLVAVSVEYE